MNNVAVKSKITITVTRSDGRVDKIGVLAGGSWWERLVATIRLMLANWRAKRGGK